ncbi:MAG: hypothetical protein Q8K74_09410 [Candidatus Nitrotoga sp.]|nr:hypothetical protein [Candidatus Nitrotoga sp.]MDO9447927.1 hypothetical protein [Candidatus Nitrotoga sp.]MDP1637652.1 hypothetical protein [Candidatus Nitrotoga sp.]MDP1856246.1 hypothetical protein [Candidatus Nitrotoga sp.]MDP3496124.1 hypothetical protein [Candidatus Nitrotoga sp.]
MKGDEERCRNAGCDRYITKPLRYEELLAEIKAPLAKRNVSSSSFSIEPNKEESPP